MPAGSPGYPAPAADLQTNPRQPRQRLSPACGGLGGIILVLGYWLLVLGCLSMWFPLATHSEPTGNPLGFAGLFCCREVCLPFSRWPGSSPHAQRTQRQVCRLLRCATHPLLKQRNHAAQPREPPNRPVTVWQPSGFPVGLVAACRSTCRAGADSTGLPRSISERWRPCNLRCGRSSSSFVPVLRPACG